MRIGIAGYGRMGAAMAARIVAQGHDIVLWNRSSGALAEAQAAGTRICATPADLAQACDVVITSLFDEAAVAEVYGGQHGLTSAPLNGRLLIETSTVRPDFGVALAAQVAAAGGRLVDSPVLGTVGPAREGRLIALVGGEGGDVADARATLAIISRAIYHMGPHGAGYAGKLAINLVKATYYAALGDGLALGQRYGIAPDSILDVIETGPAALVELPGKMPVLRGAATKPGFVIRGVLKDLEAMIAAAGGASAVPVAAGAMQAVQRAVDGGWGERDVAMIAHFAAQKIAKDA